MLLSKNLSVLSGTPTPTAHPRHQSTFCARWELYEIQEHLFKWLFAGLTLGFWHDKDESESCFHICLNLAASILQMDSKWQEQLFQKHIWTFHEYYDWRGISEAYTGQLFCKAPVFWDHLENKRTGPLIAKNYTNTFCRNTSLSCPRNPLSLHLNVKFWDASSWKNA